MIRINNLINVCRKEVVSCFQHMCMYMCLLHIVAFDFLSLSLGCSNILCAW